MTWLEIVSIYEEDSRFTIVRKDLAYKNLQIIWNVLHRLIKFLQILVQFQRKFKEHYYSPNGAGFYICELSFEMLSCDS